MDKEFLKQKAKEVRIDIINMLAEAGSGHPGGSLSCADILTLLYFDKMNVKPDNPKWEDRDRLVLSKGHAAPALYAVLAEKGFFPKEELKTLRKLGSILQGHPDMKSTPGLDMTTGSLGQGLSAANGMALAGKLDKKGYRVYVILGDGELQEGQIWEAAMTAAHYKLDNLTAILDFNGLQIDGPNREVKNIEPVNEKFNAFGWHVIEIDGHDFDQIDKAIEEAKATKGKPTLIIAHTIKGKGVSFMENQVGWHGSAPNEEQRQKAIQELEGSGV
ncbi:transketolase [Thermoanaerobacter brockii subsp. lactiethylicus]|jgi:transketolase|uniref:Transketolase domain protein n=2 Tax=Thermoanaerobacter TaxID=1754 RepID=B0KD59_THEP3|nr:MULTISPECIES: transketolase [Thermoanaerobacter]ABY92269.1 Transketolase domain protein [Thermoanaerobacter sp. X514]ABY94157.1 Transketolase domain protein [Thermoanaerobacter pseudethanolicus ATCC 33223]ADV79110.1 Transketolase domain-containing protein [Thermoanaerobacter brockii subsp. finnii Ako-1]MDI3529491.1 transketolase [Thermoanaerobacter sp.]HBW60233.1 transketolase [Thermoanaerobacter sp.]